MENKKLKESNTKLDHQLELGNKMKEMFNLGGKELNDKLKSKENLVRKLMNKLSEVFAFLVYFLIFHRKTKRLCF